MTAEKPYTVVMDWDSSQDDREAVSFQVWATGPGEAREKAEAAAWAEYGDDADYLYGVLIFEGHPAVCEY
ncbi:hypothetical protein [Streptomyces sp. NPDC057854]|uniref:hypothetical protein n=1 Tax=unclassified Streptomyces TaxID=2593676 RepID=UPI00369E5D52